MPFLKKDQVPPVGIEIQTSEPDGSEAQNDPDAGHLAAASEIMDAIHSKDVQRLADALKDMFSMLDSEPHEEGEHIEPHSYDAQKED